MATTLSISIPDAVAPRVIDGFTGQHGYQETVTDAEGNEVPNPQTKAQFAKQTIGEFVKNSVMAYEANQAVDTARTSAIDSVETDIILT